MSEKASFDGKRLRPSAYLGGVDCIDRDLEVKIVNIDPRHKFPRVRETGPVFELDIGQGEIRYMRINATTESTMVELFGPKARGWIGQTVSLYFEPEVYFGKKKVGGIRVRKGSAPAKAPEPMVSDEESLSVWENLAALIAKQDSLDGLQELATDIKMSVPKLTKEHAGSLRKLYGERMDALTDDPGKDW